MKKAELVTAVEQGGIFCLGSFLSGRAEEIQVRDKQTGGRRAAGVVREVMITDTEPVVISRWMKDGEKADSYHCAFKKGDKVVCRVTGLETQNGLIVLRGNLEPLT
jgi:exosome complex RNA-binding protein Csl4